LSYILAVCLLGYLVSKKRWEILAVFGAVFLLAFIVTVEFIVPIVFNVSLAVMFFHNALIRYAMRIAGHNNRKLYTWEGQPSFLTWLVYWCYWLLRLVSPLQHVKKIGRNKNSTSSVKILGQQKRPDFHAIDTELYFLSVLAFLAVYGFTQADIVAFMWEEAHFSLVRFGRVETVVVGIFTLESFSWIAYYLFWRNFAEEHYTLYHPAEYFVMFPLVIAVQVVGLAILFDQSPSELVFAMLGETTQDSDGALEGKINLLRLLGFFYFAVFLANLRTMIPKSEFKKTTLVNVIGSGDVVGIRILPALLRTRTTEKDNFLSELTYKHVDVYTLDDNDDHMESVKAFCIEPINHLKKRSDRWDRKNVVAGQSEIIRDLVSKQVPVIIATPSGNTPIIRGLDK